MSDLKSKAIKGLLWSSIDTYGVYFIKLVFSIAIARLLKPEDYGLIGMIAIFIAFGGLFTDGGFGDALIQKKEPTDVDYSSVFYFTMSGAFFFYVILYFSAGLTLRYALKHFGMVYGLDISPQNVELTTKELISEGFSNFKLYTYDLMNFDKRFVNKFDVIFLFMGWSILIRLIIR